MSGDRAETAERKILVDLGERSYPVLVGPGLLDEVGSQLVRRLEASRALVITSPRIGKHHGARLERSLRAAKLRSARIEIPDGDRTKNLRQVARLYEALLENDADRDTVLVALGGGVVGDIAGFTAATFLRGIRFVQVPTTLLAMVDASVGGKTGVNLPQGKNLVGAFHQPSLVCADVQTLTTLSARQISAGFAEVIKAAAIWDAEFFGDLERGVEALRALDPGALVPTLERAIRIKAEVVSRDERERDLRMLLNFGHTMAHAIEAVAGFRGPLHGEAVAIGMVYAARRSEALELAPPGTANRLEAVCQAFGLPTALPTAPRSAYLSALRVDKKKRDARVHYVVLEGIGKARCLPLTPAEIAADVPRGRSASGRGAKGKGGARTGKKTARRRARR